MVNKTKSLPSVLHRDFCMFVVYVNSNTTDKKSIKHTYQIIVSMTFVTHSSAEAQIIIKTCSMHMKIIYEPRYEKTVFCICENKDADQLRSNCAADQRLCFRYMDSTIPLLSKSEISNL